MESRSSCDLRSNIRAHAHAGGYMLALLAIRMAQMGLLTLKDEDRLHKQPPAGNVLEQEQIDEVIMRCLFPMSLFHLFFTTLYWIGYLKRVRWCLTVTIVYLIICLVLGPISIIYAFVQSNFFFVCVIPVGLVVLGYVLTVTLQLRSVMSTSPFEFDILVPEGVTTKDSPNAKQIKQTNGTQIV